MVRMRSSERGIGLVEILVASGVMAIAIAALTTAMSRLSRSSQKVDAGVDLTAIRSKLSGAIECSKTMEGRPPGNACPVATYIDLRNARNNVIISSKGQRIGPWTILAQCSPSGITVRAAKLKNGAADFSNTTPSNFLADEMNANLPYSFTGHPKAALFLPDATNPSAGLCGAWFGGGAGDPIMRCGLDEVMRGINLLSGEPVCDKAVPASQPLSNYITQVTSSDQSCGGAGSPMIYSTCPSGWLAVSCGFRLTAWNNGTSQSNAPDASFADGTSRCALRAGGHPGSDTCFRSVVTCLDISKIANGT